MGERLEVSQLHVSYRGVIAVHDFSMSVPADRCVAIVGANGAGKSSILRAISGLESKRRGGSIVLGERKLDRLRPHSRVRHGIGHVLEGRHVFADLTVRNNLELGHLGRSSRSRSELMDHVLSLFPELEPMLSRRAGILSGGQQQFLAMGRAIMGEPSVLLLDEPTVGLAPLLVARIQEVVLALKASGTTIVLVEQLLPLVEKTADEVYVLSHGQTLEHLTDVERLTEVAHRAYMS
jgi:ABC-type branched-subunit amino acid transport system ATPase component